MKKFYLFFGVVLMLIALNVSCKKKAKPTNPTGNQTNNQSSQQNQVTSNENETPMDPKLKSAKILSKFSKALMIYANENEDKLPDDLDMFVSSELSTDDVQWLLDNVKYLGKDVTVASKPDTVVAYDKTMLQQGEGTNVLYLDCHTEFAKPDKLKTLGIEAEKF